MWSRLGFPEPSSEVFTLPNDGMGTVAVVLHDFLASMMSIKGKSLKALDFGIRR